MSSTSTVSEWSLPWARDDHGSGQSALHFVVVWSLSEAARVGECAPILEPSVLGRASAQKQTAVDLPRVEFARRRPMSGGTPRELGDERISRDQLTVKPSGNAALQVERVGKCPMLVNGTKVDRATLRHGDTLSLHNVLVLLVVRRPVVPEAIRSYPAELAFPFGGADPNGLVGESPAAWSLRDELAFAASSSRHVLLLGPSGSGKELAARALHALSSRRDRPFVARNAATFPDGLVDAELFGNIKNYPNPATPDRPGLIGSANGGSLFLDEIGELAPALQAHLLRVLDRGGEYQRLGDPDVRRADIRVIAATNRDLAELKDDFVARFPLHVELPPLDDRREDIPLLARHVLERAEQDSAELGRFFEGEGDERHARVDPRLMEALVCHDFRHEVRELERLLWLAVSSSRSHFLAPTPEVLAELQRKHPEPPGARPAAELDRETIERALEASAGNVTEAAKSLGMSSRFALYRLMRRHGIRGE
jgi:two-component system nitrogen regulation response regulator GlnG/two-component system response regulator HydG